MYNQVLLLGKINSEVDNGFFDVLAKSRDKDFKETEIVVSIKVYDAIANAMKEHCNIGDLVGIQGELIYDESTIKILADKISFLSKKEVDEDESK